VDVNGCHTASAHVIPFCGAEAPHKPGSTFTFSRLFSILKGRIISTRRRPGGLGFILCRHPVELYTHPPPLEF
jgi:hypothetical protein